MLFIVYLVVQTNAINRLESVALEQSPISVEMTQKLTDIERTIGYVGFIHHFKNYIIRGEEKHYQEALSSYADAVKKVTEFQVLTRDEDLLNNLALLKKTLDEYREKLRYARSLSNDFTVEQLDKMVMVNDASAADALQALQVALLPKFEQIQNQTESELKNLSQLTLMFNLLIAPIIIIVGYFVLRVMNKAHKLGCQLTSILDMSPDGILYISEQGSILQANKKACALLGYSEAELRNLPLEQLVTSEYQAFCSHYRETVFNSDKPYAEYKPRRLKALTQSQKEVELEITIASQQIAKKNRSVCIIRDMTSHDELKLKAEKDN
ncbi:PAS domain S-box protein, partial [Vibrio sinaloensis]